MTVSFRLNLTDSCPEVQVTGSIDGGTLDHDSLLADPVDPEVGGELKDLEYRPPPARPPAEGTSAYHTAEDEANDSLQHRGPGHKGADVVPAAIPSAAQCRLTRGLSQGFAAAPPRQGVAPAPTVRDINLCFCLFPKLA